MKTTCRRRALWLLALLTVAAPGCTITQTGTPLPEDLGITPGTTRKLDVYWMYGLPKKIHYSGEEQILLYDFKQGKGMGFGLGALGIWFRFSHLKNEVDTLTVRIGPDGRVIDARASHRLKDTGFWFWPFGA